MSLTSGVLRSILVCFSWFPFLSQVVQSSLPPTSSPLHSSISSVSSWKCHAGRGEGSTASHAGFSFCSVLRAMPKTLTQPTREQANGPEVALHPTGLISILACEEGHVWVPFVRIYGICHQLVRKIAWGHLYHWFAALKHYFIGWRTRESTHLHKTTSLGHS